MNGAAASILDGAEILRLDPKTIDIDVSGRIGFFFPDKAAAFGRIMRRDGQQDLVKVSRLSVGSEFAWKLHVGLHRTVGARDEGLPIYAVEVSGTPDQLAQLEASENLIRRVVEPIEKAKFVGAFSEAVQARHAREHGMLRQQQLAVKSRWDRARNSKTATETALQEESEHTEATMASVYGWQESAVEAFGFSPRAIRRSIKIYRQLVAPFPAELVRKLADIPVGKEQKQLLDLASIEREDLRLAAIEKLIGDPELSVDGALQELGEKKVGREPTAEEKFTSAISGSWTRLSLQAQRDYLPRFVGLLTPGQKKLLRDQLVEELGHE